MVMIITKLIMATFYLQLKDLQLPTWPVKVGWSITMSHNKLIESCMCHVEMGQVVLEPKYVFWTKNSTLIITETFNNDIL